MIRLARDGTAEPVSRDQILGRTRTGKYSFFHVQLTTCRIGNLTRLIHTLFFKEKYSCCMRHQTISLFGLLCRRMPTASSKIRKHIFRRGSKTVLFQSLKKYIIFCAIRRGRQTRLDIARRRERQRDWES